MEIVEVAVYTIRVAKMKKHALFYRESILCIGHRFFVDRIV